MVTDFGQKSQASTENSQMCGKEQAWNFLYTWKHWQHTKPASMVDTQRPSSAITRGLRFASAELAQHPTALEAGRREEHRSLVSRTPVIKSPATRALVDIYIKTPALLEPTMLPTWMGGWDPQSTLISKWWKPLDCEVTSAESFTTSFIH